MNKAVIYARYSSDKQTEQSIEGQVHICQKYAESHDITIVDQYIDRAISGTTDNRVAFQQMMKDSKKKQWDIVLVYKLDRFSRDKFDMTINRRELKNNGVRIVSAMEYIPDSPEGILLESILEGYNEYYSKELSQKVKRGLRESWKKGKHTGGNTPFGYDNHDGYLSINEHEAAIVNEIFHRYANGETLPQIAEDLESRNILNRNGKPFPRSSLWNMLYNSAYIGLMKYAGEYYTGITPPIIPVDLWDRIQHMHKYQNGYNNWHKNHSTYLLSGKIFCGECGNKFIGTAGTSKAGKIFYYYKCKSKVKGPKHERKLCPSHAVNREWIENIVIEYAIAILEDEECINDIAEKVFELHNASIKENYTLELLNKKLSETKKGLTNITKAIEDGLLNDFTKERMNTLQFEKQNIEYSIHKEELRQQNEISISTIKDFLHSIIIDKTDNSKFRDLLIKSFINKVIIYQNKIEIVFNISNTNIYPTNPPDKGGSPENSDCTEDFNIRNTEISFSPRASYTNPCKRMFLIQKNLLIYVDRFT